MGNSFSDTIVALATPSGHGGVGIVRISGPRVPLIATAMLRTVLPPRQALFCSFYGHDHEILDQGIALLFNKPHSFTGEDVLELQGHGGPMVMHRLIQQVLHLGARLARPGEFSERAFLNDKIDLSQAEAIADLIAATTEQAARAAVRSLQGEFSKEVACLAEEITLLRMYIEAAIDFAEEEIDFLADQQITYRLQQLLDHLATIQARATTGSLLREGISVAIVGKPNAGKSSLLNQLTEQDTAIVTDIPGTTRDILREKIHLDGMPLNIIDTAGIRTSEDVIEQEGIRRTMKVMAEADLVLLVTDTSQSMTDPLTMFELGADIFSKITNKIIIRNKIDLSAEEPCIVHKENYHVVSLSAKTGKGIDLLKSCIKSLVGIAATEDSFSARHRHLEALATTQKYLSLAYKQLTCHKAGELVADELKQAQYALGEITGKVLPDDLLGRIFASFCIGK